MRSAFELPPGLADAGSIGIDTRALHGYLQSETIAPLPLQRLAAAHPDTVDAVFRKILRRRTSPGPNMARR